MILHSKRVEQVVDRDERSAFVKELVVAHVPAPTHGARGGEPLRLAMVRKRSARVEKTRAPVVLIHGYGQNRYAWHLPGRSFSNYLARAGFDVYNLELRGHGRSRYLGVREPGHVSEFVREDLPAAIEEVQRLSDGEPVFLVGHSLGGLVSYAAAPSLGRAVAGIATLGSPYHFCRGSLALGLLGRGMLAVDRRFSFGEGGVGLKYAAEAMRLARAFIESPVFPLPIRGFAPGSMESKVLSQHMALAMDQGSITVLRNMFLDAAESRESGHRLGGLAGFAADFEALDLPLLVIAGTKDDLAPPSSVRPAYEHSRSRDKAYRTFPRGHIDLLVGRDAPRTIWPVVEGWIGSRLGSRARASVPPTPTRIAS